MNLVGNSIKFTEAGLIAVRASVQHGTQLVLEVEDTGTGMRPDQVTSLFQPFTQADASVTRKYGGTGLGLTICRRLAEMLGGSVSLAHTAPGEGSRFQVELPLKPMPGCAWTGELPDPTTAGPRARGQQLAPLPELHGRILLAEDGLDNQRLVAHHLRKAGAQVDAVENGRLALEALENAAAAGAPYALLVTDMMMPEMDGYTLAHTLRTRGCPLPIIALTANAMAEDRARCLAAGCDDFATKPIDRKALIQTCAAWLARRKADPTLEGPGSSSTLPAGC